MKREEAMTMDTVEIKQLQQAVSRASWNLDLWKFAEAVGSEPDHDWTKEKFRQFQALSKAFSTFDPATLAKIINASA
jgi:hypothetical protein